MAFVVLDAGPLYALLDRRDQHHGWVDEQVDFLELPLRTCDAVLTETFFLLGRRKEPSRELMRLVMEGTVLLSFDTRAHIKRVLELMDAYREVPMSYADACLVCMVEQNPGATVITLDRDFTFYRQHRRRVIPLIAPFSS